MARLDFSSFFAILIHWLAEGVVLGSFILVVVQGAAHGLSDEGGELSDETGHKVVGAGLSRSDGSGGGPGSDDDATHRGGSDDGSRSGGGSGSLVDPEEVSLDGALLGVAVGVGGVGDGDERAVGVDVAVGAGDDGAVSVLLLVDESLGLGVGHLVAVSVDGVGVEGLGGVEGGHGVDHAEGDLRGGGGHADEGEDGGAEGLHFGEI